MNVFFDVDATLIADDGSLRPLVHEVFQKIKDAGHTIYVWSGVGVRWEIVRVNKLTEYVTDCFLKPLYDHHNGLASLGVKVKPDFCIDDYKSIVDAFGGVTIKPYYYSDPQDKEMLRVLAAVQERSEGTARGSAL